MAEQTSQDRGPASEERGSDAAHRGSASLAPMVQKAPVPSGVPRPVGPFHAVPSAALQRSFPQLPFEPELT